MARTFVFLRRTDVISFWEYSCDNGFRPGELHGERKVDAFHFWEKWKASFRLIDNEPRDLLFLCDDENSVSDIPPWFGQGGVSPSIWNSDLVSRFFRSQSDYSCKSVFVQMKNGGRALVWNGGEVRSAELFYGVATGDVELPVFAQRPETPERKKMEAFLMAAKERREENESRCKSLRGNNML